MSDIQKRRKDTQVLVRMDADERAMVERIAAEWGVPLSAAIRRLIRESPVGKGAVALSGSMDADSSRA